MDNAMELSEQIRKDKRLTFAEKMKTAESMIQAERAKTNDKSWSAHLLTKLFEFEHLFENFSGTNILELGSAGHLLTTRILSECGYSVHLADREDRVKFLPKGVRFTQSDWADFCLTSAETFSDILFIHGLEHIEGGTEFLSSMRILLEKGGRLHIIVPNALSLHRLIGTELGMLETPYSLNENDIRNGHVELYDIDMLQKTVISAGYSVITKCGIQLKPVTDAELFDKGDNYIKAMNRLSGRFTEYCSELYICAEAVL